MFSVAELVAARWKCSPKAGEAVRRGEVWVICINSGAIESGCFEGRLRTALRQASLNEFLVGFFN